MKAITFTVALAAALLPAVALAQEASSYDNQAPAAEAQTSVSSGPTVSFGLSAATDYVWRGVSQTDSAPAVFATVSIASGGFYLGAGTENVDFLGIDQEYDIWGGYVADLGGAKLDIGFVRYGYIDAPVNIDTIEAKAALSTNAGPVGLTLAVYHTPDYFGSSNPATYAELAASAPLAEKLTLSGAFGRQQIDRLADYDTWNLGVAYEVMPGAKVDVRYHDTGTNAFGSLGDARLVGSFSIAF